MVFTIVFLWRLIAVHSVFCAGTSTIRYRGFLTLELSLTILRHPAPMRIAIWIVGLLALGASLDSSLNDGTYTRAFAGLIQDLHLALGLKRIG